MFLTKHQAGAIKYQTKVQATNQKIQKQNLVFDLAISLELWFYPWNNQVFKKKALQFRGQLLELQL